MKNSEYYLVDHPFCCDVPAGVAVCPYCGSGLVITSILEYTLDTGEISSIEIECTSEPETDGDKWDDWFNEHSKLPYIYQLPVDLKVMAWVSQTLRVKV